MYKLNPHTAYEMAMKVKQYVNSQSYEGLLEHYIYTIRMIMGPIDSYTANKYISEVYMYFHKAQG